MNGIAFIVIIKITLKSREWGLFMRKGQLVAIIATAVILAGCSNTPGEYKEPTDDNVSGVESVESQDENSAESTEGNAEVAESAESQDENSTESESVESTEGNAEVTESAESQDENSTESESVESTEENAGESESIESTDEAELSPMALWDYNGYVDECTEYYFKDEFIDKDFDGDGTSDRLFRSYEQDSEMAYYTIEYGNGKKVDVPEAGYTGFPHIQMDDLDGDGEKDIVFNLTYDTSTDPLSVGEMWIFSYDADSDAYKEVEIPLKKGEGGERYITFEISAPTDGVLTIENEDYSFSEEFDLGQEYIEAFWGDSAVTQDGCIWYSEIQEYNGAKAVYCEIEPALKTGEMIGFYMIIKDGKASVEDMEHVGESRMNFNI